MDLSLPKKLVVEAKSFFSGLIVVDDWLRIIYSFFLVGTVSLAPLMNIFDGHILELWYPLLNILTILIIGFLLGPGVKYSKIGG